MTACGQSILSPLRGKPGQVNLYAYWAGGRCAATAAAA